MTETLKVLFIEDSEDDTLLMARELRRAGHKIDYQRVDTAESMAAALETPGWGLIIADYTMPRFSAFEALRLYHQRQLDIPFIIVSGTIGEDLATEAMRAGAHDYIIKTRLARLPPAVERELREAKTRRALRRAQLDFRLVIENFPDGVAIYREGKTVYVNRALAQYLGCGAEQSLQEQPLIDLVHPEDRTSFQQILDGQQTSGVEIRFQHQDRPDGVTLELSPVQRIEFEGQKASLLVLRDVTERNHMRAGLLVADRMASMGTLAAGVAHEINNPLASVVTNLDWLAEELLGILQDCRKADALLAALPLPPELSLRSRVGALVSPLREARESAAKVKEIARELKLFSRVEEERRELIDVRRVIESSLRLANNEIRHRAQLVTEYGTLPAVEAHEGRLGQVVLNLLVNAAQAIPVGHADQNEIRVSTRTDERGWAVLEIKDSGSGMPPEVLERIFDPFFTTKPIGVGTGLGLSICHRIVTGLGGRIEVQTQVGKGSLFRIVLPPSQATDQRRPASSPQAPASSPAPSQRARILVVDDDHILTLVLSRSLTREHEVVALNDAREAYQRIVSGERFDIIICDLMMPVMTGMDLYAELERLEKGLGKRMIFLTGGAFTPAARSFLAQNNIPRMDKPFDIRELRIMIQNIMQSSS